MNYIGTDCHISTLVFKVINEEGKLIKAQGVTTSANNYIEFVIPFLIRIQIIGLSRIHPVLK